MKKRVLSLSMILLLVMQIITIINVEAKKIQIEAGNSIENATELNLNKEYVSSLDEDKEIDWFKFTTESDAYYNISFEYYEEKQKNITLCDESKAVIDSSYQNNTNYPINIKLDAYETYYLKVEQRFSSYYGDYLGNYGIYITYKEDDIGDDYKTAKEINLNERIESRIGGETDTDWFIFEGVIGTKYKFSLTGYEGNYTKCMSLYDKNRTEIKTIYAGNNETIEYISDTSDIYYIKAYYYMQSGNVANFENAGEPVYAIEIKGESATNTPGTPPSDNGGGDNVISQLDLHNDTYEQVTEYDYKPINESHHTLTTYYEKICNKCGMVVSEYTEEERQEHYWEGNTCDECGYTKKDNTDKIAPSIKSFYTDSDSTVNRDEISKITFYAKATDNVGVTKIELSNGVVLDTEYGDSATFTILTNGLKTGENEFYVMAYDAAGNMEYSSSVYITITENTGSFSPTPPYTDPVSYTDVSRNHYLYDAVETLSHYGVLNGYSDGTFKPDNNITRAEFSAVVCRALDASVSKNATTPFYDVPYEHWASGYIAFAAGMNIVNGMGDGTFKPEGNVTYEQAVKMLVVTLGYEPEAKKAGGYPYGYMKVADDIGLTADLSIYNHSAPTTRGIVAKLTYNALFIPMMEQVGFGSSIEYEVMDGKNGRALVNLMTDLAE